MLRSYHEELEVNMVLTLNHQTRGCVVCHWIGVREIYTGNLYTGNLGCHLEIRGFSIWQWQITSWWLVCRGYSLTMLNCQWITCSIHVLSQTWTNPKMNQIESNHTFLLINIPISNLANPYKAAYPVNSSGVLYHIYHKCNSYLSFNHQPPMGHGLAKIFSRTPMFQSLEGALIHTYSQNNTIWLT